MVRKGNREWVSIAVEAYIKKLLENYKKKHKLHSMGEAIEKLLEKEK